MQDFMQDEQPLLIDIDHILREKAPSKYRYVPRFLINYLRRIVHEGRLNDFFRQSQHERGVGFLQFILQYLDVKVQLNNAENLPAQDAAPWIFVCNHPLGAIDGVGVGALLGVHYDGRIRYIVNDLLMNVKGLAPLCIPVNKTGGQSRTLPGQIATGLAEPNHLIMFPAGLCSRRKGGVVRDVAWGKQFIVQSVKTQRDVVPLYFSGRNSNFFYRLADLRALLGIKLNVEMLYLSDEMFRQEHGAFTLTAGKPIPWQTFDSSRTPREWSKYVYDIVYKLSE
jgi:putative hemolysin